MNDLTIFNARKLAFMDRVRPQTSKIWHLADELFTEAIKAHLAGVSFAKMRADAGISEPDLPSQAAWVKFWGSFRPFLRLARRRAAAEGANASAAEARHAPAEFDEALLDLIRQLAYELADSDAANAREVSVLGGLLLKQEDQRLKERLVEVAERRVALTEKQRAATTTPEPVKTRQLSAKQRERKWREIFGIYEVPGARPRTDKHPKTPKNTRKRENCAASEMTNGDDKEEDVSLDDPDVRRGDEKPKTDPGAEGEGEPRT